MATCPKCGDYLGRHHRCWGGKRRRRDVVLTLAGAAAGFVAGLLLIENPTAPLPFITAMLGGILALAVRRYARF